MKLLIYETGGSRLLHKFFQLIMTSEKHPFSEILGGVPSQIAYGDATKIPKNGFRVPHVALKSFQGRIWASIISTEEFEKFWKVVFHELFRTYVWMATYVILWTLNIFV